MTTAGGLYIPKANFAVTPAAVTPAATLNKTATSPQSSQLTVAASNAPLRVIYGQVRVGAQIANVVPYGSTWVVQVVWGEGPVEQIVSCQFNDEALPAGVTHTDYLGTAVQTVNSTLVAAFASNGQTYTDSLPGIAYSVFSIPAGDLGMPQIAAVIKGRKVRNPGSATAWSDNPALCLADFLESTTYGLGRTVDDTSLAEVRDACDELVSGVKRRTFGLAIDSVQGVSQWVDTLRAYASCWVVMDESTALLIPDRPRATDASFLHASGQIYKLGNLKKRGVAQAPTAIEIRYTDTSVFPWREASVWAYASGVLAGTTARRDSQVAMPGIQSASQAQREATERLNKLWLADLSFQCDIFDEGLKLQLGDVVEVTHPIGLAAKPMRVLGINGDYGRYSLNLSEYDPACYSDSVASDPTYSDTNLPSPANPPAVTGLVASEEVFQLENGTYSSRIRLTWDAPEWPYLHDYTITIERSGAAIDMRRQTSTTYASAAVQEGIEYVCKVAVISSIGATGTVAQDNITPLGKYMLPNPVPAGSLTAFEAGGTVYLSWGQATDIDIWRYRLKRGTTAQTYAQAAQIDLLDALRYQDKTTPVGTWRFWVEVVDSVAQESGTPRYIDVVVTSDASAFLVDSYDQTAPTLTNMVEFALARTDSNRYAVTEDGVAFATKFSSNLSTYTNALATYHSSVTSTWEGEGEDFGQLLGGQWTGIATVSALNGSLISYMGFSPDGTIGSYTYLTGLSQKTNARFARMKHEALTTSTMLVTVPTQNIKLNSVPREETGTITTSATLPATVFLANSYSSTKSLQLTVQGSAARTVAADNIRINGSFARGQSTELGAGYEVLQFDSELEVGSTGNQFWYPRFADASSYTTQVGDYLEFDFMLLEGQESGFNQYLCLYNGTWGSGTWLFGAQQFNTAGVGVWGSKRIVVDAVGLAITHCMYVNESDVVGKSKALLRNVRITDGAGSTRRVLWQSGRQAALSDLHHSSGYINCGINRANAFDVYSFNGATQSSDLVQWTYQGV